MTIYAAFTCVRSRPQHRSLHQGDGRAQRTATVATMAANPQQQNFYELYRSTS